VRACAHVPTMLFHIQHKSLPMVSCCRCARALAAKIANSGGCLSLGHSAKAGGGEPVMPCSCWSPEPGRLHAGCVANCPTSRHLHISGLFFDGGCSRCCAGAVELDTCWKGAGTDIAASCVGDGTPLFGSRWSHQLPSITLSLHTNSCCSYAAITCSRRCCCAVMAAYEQRLECERWALSALTGGWLSPGARSSTEE